MATLLGTGAYGIREAAQLALVHPRTAHRWVAGAGRGRAAALLRPDLPRVGHRRALSFLDLIDLLVVGRFREAGVSFQTIRRVYGRLEQTLATRHPFGHRRLLTDGTTVFMETLDHVGDRHLHEVLSGQGAMPVVLLPYLEKIDYAAETYTAVRWRIAEGIVLDPARSFGKPILADAGTSTFVLARSYHANNDDADLVADLFDVSPQSVRRAVEFESRLAAGRAA